MERLIGAIQDWPVIVQGVIGSALFWFVLVLGQKVAEFSSVRISDLSKKKKRSDLLNQLLRFRAYRTRPEESAGSYASILWFRASRHVLKGLIWLTLGLIFDALAGVLGIVGFIGCLYYLFVALNIVRSLQYDGDIDQKIKELEEQIAEIVSGRTHR